MSFPIPPRYSTKCTDIKDDPVTCCKAQNNVVVHGQLDNSPCVPAMPYSNYHFLSDPNNPNSDPITPNCLSSYDLMPPSTISTGIPVKKTWKAFTGNNVIAQGCPLNVTNENTLQYIDKDQCAGLKDSDDCWRASSNDEGWMGAGANARNFTGARCAWNGSCNIAAWSMGRTVTYDELKQYYNDPHQGYPDDAYPPIKNEDDFLCYYKADYQDKDNNINQPEKCPPTTWSLEEEKAWPLASYSNRSDFFGKRKIDKTDIRFCQQFTGTDPNTSDCLGKYAGPWRPDDPSPVNLNTDLLYQSMNSPCLLAGKDDKGKQELFYSEADNSVVKDYYKVCMNANSENFAWPENRKKVLWATPGGPSTMNESFFAPKEAKYILYTAPPTAKPGAPRSNNKHACDIWPQYMNLEHPYVCERYNINRYGKDWARNFLESGPYQVQLDAEKENKGIKIGDPVRCIMNIKKGGIFSKTLVHVGETGKVIAHKPEIIKGRALDTYDYTYNVLWDKDNKEIKANIIYIEKIVPVITCDLKNGTNNCCTRLGLIPQKSCIDPKTQKECNRNLYTCQYMPNTKMDGKNYYNTYYNSLSEGLKDCSNKDDPSACVGISIPNSYINNDQINITKPLSDGYLLRTIQYPITKGSDLLKVDDDVKYSTILFTENVTKIPKKYEHALTWNDIQICNQRKEYVTAALGRLCYKLDSTPKFGGGAIVLGKDRAWLTGANYKDEKGRPCNQSEGPHPAGGSISWLCKDTDKEFTSLDDCGFDPNNLRSWGSKIKPKIVPGSESSNDACGSSP